MPLRSAASPVAPPADSVSEGVRILRPLLPVPKAELRAFAAEYLSFGLFLHEN